VTAFPAGITTGATWDKALMYARGVAMGKEFRGKGANVHLGPSVGPLGRKPLGGRNWEGFGADPVLQAKAAALHIKGVQEQGVISTIKHYIGNEQEMFRMYNPFQPGYSANIGKTSGVQAIRRYVDTRQTIEPSTNSTCGPLLRLSTRVLAPS
jgi:beta-glucosidase